MSVTLDASTALAAVLPDENSEFARAAPATGVREGLVVPALWPYEVQNGLVTAFGRKRIDREPLADALEALRAFEPALEAPHGLGYELRLAQTHLLSAYDAAYLGVALATGSKLATNDERLRHAAQTVGVTLI
jgi:predicted nucleic acid-binding protein